MREVRNASVDRRMGVLTGNIVRALGMGNIPVQRLQSRRAELVRACTYLHWEQVGRFWNVGIPSLNKFSHLC
jgi:hypothetical protein